MLEHDLDNSEQSFIAEGLGNGCLHPTLVRNVDAHWNGGDADDYLFVGFEFTPTDWHALFHGVLRIAELGEPKDGEDYQVFAQRAYDNFQEEFRTRTASYPMIGRITDIYKDAGYASEEVGQLRAECLRLQSETSHRSGRRALAKLTLACDKALESEMALLLSSD